MEGFGDTVWAAGRCCPCDRDGQLAAKHGPALLAALVRSGPHEYLALRADSKFVACAPDIAQQIVAVPLYTDAKAAKRSIRASESVGADDKHELVAIRGLDTGCAERGALAGGAGSFRVAPAANGPCVHASTGILEFRAGAPPPRGSRERVAAVDAQTRRTDSGDAPAAHTKTGCAGPKMPVPPWMQGWPVVARGLVLCAAARLRRFALAS